MALRTVIFRNMDTGEELTMPVAPGSFDVEEGRMVESLDMAGTGQVNLPGLETLFNKTQEFLLPARDASYVTGGWQRPYDIIEKLTNWSLRGHVVRYIIYGTAVNSPVLIEAVRYREQDGTNDVYLTLTLKKYRYLTAVSTVAPVRSTDNDIRPDEGQAVSETTYTVQQGDCLWTIAQKFYGDGSLCYRLATYNSIPNSFLIHPGDVLKIPDVAVVKATAPTPAGSGSAGGTAPTPAGSGSAGGTESSDKSAALREAYQEWLQASVEGQVNTWKQRGLLGLSLQSSTS